jgi:periplasmic copper chaperone A
MNRIVSSFATAALLVALSSAGALSGDAKVGDITVEGPWARASAGKAMAGAAFMSLSNAGATDDRLTGVSAGVSDKAELHTHIKEGNIMRMRPVEAVDVPAGGVATLEPGGDHVMFMGLHEPLKEGETFPLTLTFEKAGEVTVEVVVMKAGAMGHGSMHGHGAMPMKKQ